MREPIQDVENRRAAAKVWGTDAEEFTLGELFATFIGNALIMAILGVVIICVFGEPR